MLEFEDVRARASEVLELGRPDVDLVELGEEALDGADVVQLADVLDDLRDERLGRVLEQALCVVDQRGTIGAPSVGGDECVHGGLGASLFSRACEREREREKEGGRKREKERERERAREREKARERERERER